MSGLDTSQQETMGRSLEEGGELVEGITLKPPSGLPDRRGDSVNDDGKNDPDSDQYRRGPRSSGGLHVDVAGQS